MADAKNSGHFLNKDNNLYELSLVFLTCDAIKNGHFEEALNYANKLPDTGLGQYARPLLRVWSLAGMEKFDEARTTLKEEFFELDPTYHMHAGLLAEFQNNNKEAAEHYKIAMANGLELLFSYYYSQLFERYGKPEISADIYIKIWIHFIHTKLFSRSRRDNTNLAIRQVLRKGLHSLYSSLPPYFIIIAPTTAQTCTEI